MAYEICKDCVDKDGCYIWHAVEQLKEQLFGGCPFKVIDEEEDDKEIKKMVRYEIRHCGDVLYRLTTDKQDADIGIIVLMIALSDENEGDFALWAVEIDPETGREKYTQIASAKNGVEI